MSRVLVIGAGVGGLATAARLGAAGHDVTVVEQAPEVGGKLGTLEVGGHVFDTGPSLVTMPHLLDELYASTGVDRSAVLPLQRLDVACRYRFPDGTGLDLPGEAADVPAALDDALGAGAGAQWSALMDRAAAMWAVVREPFLESPVSAGGLLRMSRRLDHVRTVAPGASLRGVGARYLHDPRLRMLLDRYATYTGSDPRRAPAALLTVPYAEQAFGSWHVPGGLGRIATTLVERVLERGGRLRLGTEVTGIVLDGGRAAGVRLADGGVVPADVVVANADAQDVHRRLLPPGTARLARARLRRTEPSLSGFVLLLGLDDAPPAPHHRVLFPDDYEAEFDDVFGRGGPPRPVDAPTVYISAPDDPALVPRPGAGSWFVLVNAARHEPGTGVDWDEPGRSERYADRLLDLMAARGVDVRDRVRHRVVLSPADLERRTRAPGGAIYGTASHGPAAAFLRPANRSPVPGLFLVGGSSHPGGGLPLVVLSSRIVAGLVGPA